MPSADLYTKYPARYESIQSLTKQQRLLLNTALKPVHKVTITDITRCSLELFGAILSRPGKNALYFSDFSVFCYTV